MATLALIDSLPALAHVRAAHPGAVAVTDNPLLAADPRSAGAVDNADALIDQPACFALGRLAIEVANALDAHLRARGIEARFGLVPGHVRLAGLTSRLVAGVLYRASLLARLVADRRPGRLVLALHDAPAWDPAQPLVPPRFGAPYAGLAARGFVDGVEVVTEPVPVPVPARVNDTGILDLGRRIAPVPAAALIHEGLARLGLESSVGGATLAVGAGNEALDETLLWLWLRGYRLVRLGSPARAAAEVRTDPAAPPPTGALDAEIADWLAANLAATDGLGTGQVRAVAHLISGHVAAGLDHLGRQAEAVRRHLDSPWPGARRPRALLTNGLIGPLGAQIYGLLSERGVPVIDFEHGVTTSLSALSQARIDASEAAACDLLLVCAEDAARAFRKANRADAPVVHTIGLADQTRRLLRPRWQRRLARRRLGLGADAAVVMHVSTLPYSANMRPGYGTPSETTIFALDTALLTQVYARIRHRVVFKQYPTQRFPHEPPYDAILDLAPNIAVTKDEDFRYLRAAADVIVTLTPTSALGWCVGAGVPLVWLDSRLVNPLAGEALRRRFRASFLFVDLDSSDWPQRLAALLDRPLAAIRADWQACAPARRALLADAISGPPQATGRTAARVIDRYLTRRAVAKATESARERAA